MMTALDERDRHATMFGLLSREAMLEAAHDLYTIFHQDAEQEAGLPVSDWRDVPRQPDDVQLPIIAYYAGRLHQAWGFDPGLVFYHMGMTSPEQQARCLYLVLMSTLGHGIGITDDHAEAWDRAAEVLLRYSDRTAFDLSPFLADGSEWEELAREAVRGRGVAFYREPNGDFLCVWTANGRNPDGTWSGRAAAIGGLASSACTTGISDKYLAGCEWIAREAVPAEWLRDLGE